MVTLHANYDEAEDVLLLRSKKPVSESIEVLDGVVIDFDNEGNIAGLELFDAHGFLSADNKALTKDLLADEVQVKARNYRNYIFITLIFKEAKIKEKLPPFSLEVYRSPLLAE